MGWVLLILILFFLFDYLWVYFRNRRATRNAKQAWDYFEKRK